MDVRLVPNEILQEPKDEINQPMYATAVGLIMWFDYRYIQEIFIADRKEVFSPRLVVIDREEKE